MHALRTRRRKFIHAIFSKETETFVLITVPSKDYRADDISLLQILNSTTKANMLSVCKKFDLYVSPNVKKIETARRIADELMDNPIEVVSRLSKVELQIIDEFVNGDDTTYVVRKQRKTPYMLQKYFMVVTYCDDDQIEWHMLMPSDIRKALSADYKFYLDLALQGKKGPSAKDLRRMAFLCQLFGEEE